MSLNARAEILLKALVERYISDGQPVGSRTLAKEAGLDLSPATVRNVMADLEEMGLVVSPHTSAGRVPTQQGYRVFVDSLLKVRTLDAAALREIGDKLHGQHDPQQLLENASQLLSEVTRLAGLVLVPRRPQQYFRQMEFLHLGRNRVLVILVTQDGQVQNRAIVTDRDYSGSELVEAANFFNDAYAGFPLREVRLGLLSEMQRDSDELHRVMRAAVEMGRQMFADDEAAAEGDALVVSGEANLFDVPDLSDVHQLRQLFHAFKTKQDLLHLLDKSMRASGVQIFIGRESGYEVLSECSVVTAPYDVEGRVVGTLGVVGPTRMPYEQVIPIVDITARLLSSALSH